MANVPSLEALKISGKWVHSRWCRTMGHSHMAIIFEFKHADPPARDAQQRAQSACEIILFPGVRYERWADAPPAAPASTQIRKRRAKKVASEMAE
jgi:hypothetical protein